jgi:NHL repeat
VIQKLLTKTQILFLLLVIVYSLGNNILYLSSLAYADQPDEINKIENCKNEKIVKKTISKTNIKNKDDKDNNFNLLTSIDNQKFHHIKKFNSTGVLIDSFGIKGNGKGEFLHPHGIGSDSKGNIYVSDSGNVHFRANYDCNQKDQDS